MMIGVDIGKKRVYSRAFKDNKIQDIVKWEVIKVKDGQSIKLTLISCISEHRQGIWLATDRGIEINGNVYSQVDIWQDSVPKEIIIKCHTNVGLLSIYNIWDDGNGRESQAYSSGMKVIEKQNATIYKCNDYGFNTNFDKLIFSIEKL